MREKKRKMKRRNKEKQLILTEKMKEMEENFQ
jgi:hypothetical protein